MYMIDAPRAEAGNRGSSRGYRHRGTVRAPETAQGPEQACRKSSVRGARRDCRTVFAGPHQVAPVLLRMG